MKIYFCKHSNGVEQAVHTVEKKFPTLKAEIKNCIHQCSRCKKNLVARLDGQEIQGVDEKSLVKEVKAILKKKGKLETKDELELELAKKERTTKDKKSSKNKDKKSKDKRSKDKKTKKPKTKKPKNKDSKTKDTKIKGTKNKDAKGKSLKEPKNK